MEVHHPFIAAESKHWESSIISLYVHIYIYILFVACATNRRPRNRNPEGHWACMEASECHVKVSDSARTSSRSRTLGPRAGTREPSDEEHKAPQESGLVLLRARRGAEAPKMRSFGNMAASKGGVYNRAPELWKLPRLDQPAQP